MHNCIRATGSLHYCLIYFNGKELQVTIPYCGFPRLQKNGLQKMRKEESDCRTASNGIMGYSSQSSSFVSASLMRNIIDEVIDACNECIQN